MNCKLISTTAVQAHKTACLVLAIFGQQKLSDSAKIIDQNEGGTISNVLKLGGLGKTIGSSHMLYELSGIKAERILLINCGKQNRLNAADFHKIVSSSIDQLNKYGVSEATLCLSDLQVQDQTIDWHIQQAILSADAALYQFDQFKSSAKTKPSLRKLSLNITGTKALASKQKIAKQSSAISSGIRKTKDLGNLPGNVCTPSFLAKEAKALQKKFPKLKTSILSEAEMKKLGMGAFLSVSKGSDEPGKLIVMQYMNGKKGKKPAVLVGKGITFDTGGISIKPSAKMDEMKYDMCGAATVFGVMTACLEMGLPINIIGVVAAAENMPSGRASKPGDIVTSMSGQTIEILNTDAEGRLVLCDALSYAERFKPAAVIDIATLTGACIVGLGRIPSAMYSNHEPLANALIKAGENSTDRVWRMPLWDEYQEQLQSNFADFSNLGGPDGGSITAACFLSRFTQSYHWAHLDIAGTAWKTGPQKGATGRPVSLLMNYLINNHADKR